MKISLPFWLAICLAAPLHAQQREPPVASPPPLPSPPYLKSPPSSSQWLITYSQGEAAVTPAAHAPAMNTRAGLAKKTVVVTKNPGIVSETTALQNGAVTHTIRTPALSVTQLSGSNEWLPSTGGQNGFNETDFSKNDFAGFDWLSQKSYVGVQDIAKRPCFVFHDKIVTADPPELDLIRASMEKTSTAWKIAKEQQERLARVSTPAISGTRADRQKSSTATPTPNDSPPPSFDIKDYMREVTAYIDVETGLPALLTYQTQERSLEKRSYTFMPAPSSPLTLPPEVQGLLENRQAHLKRLATPAGAP